MNLVSKEQLTIAAQRRALIQGRTLFWQLVTVAGTDYAHHFCRVLRRLSKDDTESPEQFEKMFASWSKENPNRSLQEFIEGRLMKGKVLN